MNDLKPFLKSLLSAPGLSASETPVARLIADQWRPLVDEIQTSRLGSLHALKRGTAPSAAKKRPCIMLTAHMDAIGLMVTSLAGEFLHVTGIGGIDYRLLPGTPVIVHASGSASPQELYGVIAQPHPHALPPGSSPDQFATVDQLLVDAGLSARQLSARVRIGDLVSFETQPLELGENFVSGHSLDNRASIAALTVALEQLSRQEHLWDVWLVATSQEEVGLKGARTSAFDLHPDLALVLDVTFASGPDASDWATFPLGKGPTLAFGPQMHPYLFKKFKELAEKLEIPVSLEMAPVDTSTDTAVIQLSAEGIPTMLLGLPLRYMHSPVELVSVKDIQRAGRLAAEFISALEVDFLEKITWDD